MDFKMNMCLSASINKILYLFNGLFNFVWICNLYLYYLHWKEISWKFNM